MQCFFFEQRKWRTIAQEIQTQGILLMEVALILT